MMERRDFLASLAIGFGGAATVFAQRPAAGPLVEVSKSPT
jgi:hypothetical protein